MELYGTPGLTGIPRSAPGEPLYIWVWPFFLIISLDLKKAKSAKKSILKFLTDFLDEFPKKDWA